MRLLLFFISFLLLFISCSETKPSVEYLDYEDIDFLMTKSENEITEYLTNKKWANFKSKEAYINEEDGSTLRFIDKNGNNLVDQDQGELLFPIYNYSILHLSSYYVLYEISMTKKYNLNGTSYSQKVNLITNISSPNKRELIYTVSPKAWSNIENAGFKKCTKSNSYYNDKYLFEKNEKGYAVFKIDSDEALLILKEERDSKF